MVLAVIGFSLSGASYSAESDKPEPKPGPKPDKMTAPRMGNPAGVRDGRMKQSDKPEPKPGPKPDKMTAPGQALPMPQGTQGSR